MIFKTIQEAFNYYRSFTNEQLEKRATEIKGTIETDPNVDINSLNIELTAIKQAKDNNDQKEPGNDPEARSQAFKMIESLTNKPEAIDPENAVNSKEYRNAFFKSLLGRPLNQEEKRAFNCVMEQRADSFNNAGNSVAVLPTNTLNEVIALARTQGGLLAEARAFNVPIKIAIPVGTPTTKAQWHTEGEEVESEKVATASVIFEGNEIIKILSISKKVEKMSIDAFESYLVEELTACVMETLETAIVNGTGSGQGTGLEKGITWTEGTNLLTVAETEGFTAYTDFVSMLKRGYAKGSKIALNNSTLYKRVYGCHDDNNRPVFIADPKGESVGKILGFEVVIDDNIADDTFYMGNFKKYYGFNLADGINIEKSTESSFKKNLIDFKATAIADCKPLVQEAFIKMVLTPTA